MNPQNRNDPVPVLPTPTRPEMHVAPSINVCSHSEFKAYETSVMKKRTVTIEDKNAIRYRSDLLRRPAIAVNRMVNATSAVKKE